MPRNFGFRYRNYLRACAALSAAIAPVLPATAKTSTATWRTATSGLWSDDAKWSTSDYPNNGFPRNTDYDVRIAASGAAYTVTLNTADVTVNSLLLNSASATLQHTYGALILPTINLNAGTYLLSGGTLRNATVSGAGNFRVDTAALFNTLDNVTLGTNLTILAPAAGTTAYTTTVQNGLDLVNNATVSVNAGGLDFWGTQSLAGTGSIVFNGATPSLLEGSNGTLTIAAGVQVRTGAGSGTISRYYDTDAVHNYGTLSSNTAGNTLTLSNVTNFGTVESANGGHLNLYGFQNAGTVSVSGPGKLFLGLDWSTSTPINVTGGADVELAGNFTTASLRNINRTGPGGSLIITGAVNNAGQTLALDSITGAWPLYDYVTGGTIRGGTVTALNPATGLTLPYVPIGTPLPAPGGTFDSLTVDTNLTLNDYFTLAGDVTLPAGHRISLRQGTGTANGNLYLSGGSRLLGAGEIVFDTGLATIRPTRGGGTIGPDITVRTAFGSGVIGDPNYASPTNRLTLQGLVTAPVAGQSIRVQGHWSNTGTFQASNSGIILLTGTSDSLGTLRASANGSIRIVGLDYDNTGKTLTADANSGNLSLGTYTDIVERVTTIHGGTLATSGPYAFQVTRGSTNSTPGAKFDGVTVAGNVTVTSESELHTTNGMTLSGGRISLIGAPAQSNMTALFADGTQTWSGTGEIVFDGPSFYSHVAPKSGTLTIAPGITIRSGAAGGAVGEFTAGALLVNQGTISARAGKNITVWGNWDNTLGTFEANAATLHLLGNVTSTQLGTLRTLNNGAITFGGNLDNSGRTLALNDSTGHLTIYAGATGAPSVVTGGTLATTGSARFFLSNLKMDGVTLTGTSIVTGQATVENNLTLHGNLFLDPAKVLNFPGTQSLLGTGTIAPINTGTPPTLSGTDLTVGPGITLRAGLPSGLANTLNVTTTGTLTNQGLISADLPGGYVFVGGTINNQGTIQAVNQANLWITANPGPNPFTNTGTLRIGAGSWMRIRGAYSVDRIGHVENAGTLFLDGTLTNPGTLNIDDSLGRVSLVGSLTGGTLAVSGAGSLGLVDNVYFYGVTLAGHPTLSAGTIRAHNGLSVAANSSVTLNGAHISTVLGHPAGPDGYHISGPGEIVFDKSTSSLSSNYLPWAASPDLTIRTGASGGNIGFIQNAGTILAQTPGAVLDVFGDWSNSGLMKATNGGVLNLSGNWSNTGTIVVDPGSTLWLGGTVSTPGLGSIQFNGGTTHLIGTLDNSNNTLAFGPTTGAIFLGGEYATPTITGGTLTTTGGTSIDVVTNSTLNAVSLNANVNIRPGVTLQLTNPQPSTGPARITLSDSSLSVYGNQPLAGPVEIVFDGTPGTPTTINTLNNLFSPVPALALTVGADVTVRTGATGGRISHNAAFANYGTISAQTPGQALYIYGANNRGLIAASNSSTAVVSMFTNFASGTLAASTGGTLDLTAPGGLSYNAGSITADAATIKFSGTWWNVGTISAANGSTLNLEGTWTNDGTITANDSTLVLATLPTSLGNISTARSTVTLAGGTITTAQLAPFASGGNSITLTTGMTLNNAGATLDISDLNLKLTGATISGGTLASTSKPLTVTSGTLTGVIANAPIAYSPITSFASLTTNDTTFNQPLTYTGPASPGATSTRLLLNGTWSNTSNLSVTNGSLTLSPTGSNTGTITLDNASLTFGSFAGLGTVHRTGGSATFTGTIENAGTTFDPNVTPAGPVALGPGSRINGGVLSSASPILVQAGRTPTTFDAVTLASDLTVSVTPAQEPVATIQTLNGLTIGPGATLTLEQFATLRPSGAQTYAGPGTILLNGGRINFTGAHITFGPNLTIRSGPLASPPGVSAAANIFYNHSSSAGTASLTNDGTISAETPDKAFILSGPAFTNNGTLRATGGGTFSLTTIPSNYTYVSGTGTLTGGTYQIHNTSTLKFPNIPGSLAAYPVHTNAATLLLSGPTSTFASLAPLTTNAGALTLTDGRVFTTEGALTNTGSITLGESATLSITGPFSNSGTVDLASLTATLTLLAGTPADNAALARQMIATGNLTSSLPDPNDLYSIAYIPSPTTLTVHLALTGDANLDGLLNADDYALLDRGHLMDLPNPGWSNGDFNHDNTITDADYLLIDRAYLLTKAQGSQSLGPSFVSMRNSQFGPTYVQQLLTSIPEPAGLLPLAAGLATLPRRHRRRTTAE